MWIQVGQEWKQGNSLEGWSQEAEVGVGGAGMPVRKISEAQEK